MQKLIIFFCFLHFGCAYHYTLTTVNRPDYACKRLALIGDTLICFDELSSVKISLDSVSQLQRHPRLGGTLAFGGAGAFLGAFGGAVIGAIFAWGFSAKSPEHYVYIPALLGSVVGFFAGKSLWAILDTKTLYPMSIPADERHKAVQNFVE